MKIYKKISSLQEVNNLIFIQNKISCPKYIQHYKENNQIILEMEWIEGQTLFNIMNTNKMSDTQNEKIVSNIIKEINKLRNLKYNEININKTINDSIFNQLNFTNEKELNKIILSQIKNDNLYYICNKILPKNSKFFLSHGELFSENIIVKKDLSIVFTNWKNMTYLPEYWDYIKILIPCTSNNKIQQKIITKIKSKMNILILILCFDLIINDIINN